MVINVFFFFCILCDVHPRVTCYFIFFINHWLTQYNQIRCLIKKRNIWLKIWLLGNIKERDWSTEVFPGRNNGLMGTMASFLFIDIWYVLYMIWISVDRSTRSDARERPYALSCWRRRSRICALSFAALLGQASRTGRQRYRPQLGLLGITTD